MSVLLNRVAALLLIAWALPAFAADTPTEQAPPETPAQKPSVEKSLAEPAPAPKPLTAKERLKQQAQESYQRLKELRETLAQLDGALASSDADKAWEYSAQLKVLWEVLSSKQRISIERRYPGTKARVERAITEGKALARAAAPKEPVARAKDAERPMGDGEVALVKKDEAKKPEVEPVKKSE